MIPWTQQHQGAAVPRPKTGETPIRHVRVDDTLWGQIGEIAREQGRSVSAVVLDALRGYVGRRGEQYGDDVDRADLAAADAELAERRARKGGRPRKT